VHGYEHHYMRDETNPTTKISYVTFNFEGEMLKQWAYLLNMQQ